jgi:DNA invertase Pin-like site-specific DNA recombinase
MIHGYVRVSAAEQAADDRTSLQDQERRIRAAALLHDVDDPPIWCDIGVSGSVPLTRRGAGRAMLSEIEPGDTIVSAKLDRLFRSASDALTQAEELHRSGIDIVLLDTGTEPVMSSASGKLFFSMLAAFAEFERARIRERISDGKRGKMARGGHAGGEPPYGFLIVGSGRGAMLVENDQEQKVMAEARRLRGSGISLSKVARMLTEHGYRSRTGTPFTAVQVRRWALRKDTEPAR